MPLDQDSKRLLTDRPRIGLKALEKVAIALRPQRPQIEKRYQASRAADARFVAMEGSRRKDRFSFLRLELILLCKDPMNPHSFYCNAHPLPSRTVVSSSNSSTTSPKDEQPRHASTSAEFIPRSR